MDITVLQLHKRASYEFKYIQDKYSINSGARTFALSDGTTQSFKSEIWAELITKAFVRNPKFSSNEIIPLFAQCVEIYKNTKFEFSSNPARASLEKTKLNKGGTATFLGLQFKNDNKIDVISCGDTNLFVLNSTDNIFAFPFTDIESLDSNNHFINTNQLIENNIDGTFFKERTIECKPNDIIIIATDALSRLILEKPSTISELIKIKTFNQYLDFCIKNWDNKELQEDDISAIIIPVADIGKVNSICPPTNFSFPKEKEKEFIPKSLEQNIQKVYTDMEINEIRNQFNGIAQDFHKVKTKLKLMEVLLIVIISLVLINFLYSLFFQKNLKRANSFSQTQLQQKLIEKESINRNKQRVINKLNKQLKEKEELKINKEIITIVKEDNLIQGVKPKETQAVKKQNKESLIPIEKKKDQTSNKGQ
jgi:hypothetical protein